MYLQYFPEFEKFTWLHHIHGALMASWIMLLVVQPVLIYKGLCRADFFYCCKGCDKSDQMTNLIIVL